jgi:hypothetical protein
MKRLIPVLAALCLGCTLGLAQAADTKAEAKPKSEAQLAQQEKMKACNADAKDKTGDDRKVFMKECLSAKGVTATPTQQDKMKVCNADAKGKTGDDRKAFMKTCLSAKPAA